MSNPNRVQPGVPTGGQFARSARGEADVSLDTPAAPPSSDVAALVAEIRASRAKQDAEMAEMSAEAERTGYYNRFDEVSADYNEAAAADLERLLDALDAQQPQLQPQGRSGVVEYVGDETRVEGSFGEVIVSPRDPDSGPGTIVMVDTAGQADGHPVVVMINDETYEIPVESDSGPGLSAAEKCQDCGRHVDDCLCADRSIGPESSPEELVRALSNANSRARSGQRGAEAVVHRLHAHVVAKALRDDDPNARYLNLDWGPSGGLEPVATADAFGDSDGPLNDYMAADLIGHTSNLRADGEAIERAPAGSKTPYRLDIDHALGEAIWR